MAVVVEQTIPFSSSNLDVGNFSRWKTLLPLIRPSVRAITIENQTILVDDSAINSDEVCVAALGQVGNFSSKFLESRHVCAVASKVVLVAQIAQAVRTAGVQSSQGLVVVRSGHQRDLDLYDEVVEVEVDGDLEMDHVLHLLGNATQETRYVALGDVID